MVPEISKEAAKTIFLRWRNAGIVALTGLALFMLVVSWGVSVQFEGQSLKRRHVASILGFILSAATIVGFVLTNRGDPYGIALYALQLVTLLSLFLVGVSMGMNALVVDLCSAGEVNKDSKIRESLTSDTVHGIHCSAHYAEYVGSLFLMVALGGVYLTTQQQVVTLVDKGVLKGIGSRMARLP